MRRFAIKTLLADRGKLLTGVAGVIFSLVLVSLQGGLYLGLNNKASLLIDHCDADLWITHQQIENVDLAREIPESWLNRVRSAPGVAAVQPYIVGKGTAALTNGHMEDVWVIGSEPSSMLGTGRTFVAGSPRELRRPDAVSFDEVDAAKLGNPRLGDWLEVNGQRARIVAKTSGVTGFITMPYLFTTLETARRLSRLPSGMCSYFLVQLKADTDRDEVIRLLRRRVPHASVLTPEEFARMSQHYWMQRTGVGLSFGAATALGLLVGLLMVGQSLYTLALDHREDYATLKALGADDGHVWGVIVVQALTIAVTGSVAGLAVVGVIARFWNSPLARLEIHPPLLGLAVAIVLLICLVASLVPFARIRHLDPAQVLIE